MIGQAPHAILTGVPGWETIDEQSYLIDLAEKVPENGDILEIGGEFGMSASLFAAGSRKSVHVTTIDLFPDRPEGKLLDIHRANLQEAGLLSKCSQIQGDSGNLGIKWEGQIDLLFIDGDHSYNGVKADIQAWIKFVPVGGIVAFHDCACATNKMPHVSHFEVTQAVSEWFWATKGKWKALPSVDTILSFERVK